MSFKPGGFLPGKTVQPVLIRYKVLQVQTKMQRRVSGSALILVVWIRIPNGNADPDLGGKNEAREKKYSAGMNFFEVLDVLF